MGEPPKLDLRSLRYVLAISTSGSFARAAAVLGITQPALSRSVRALERSLHVTLFDRSRSGTFPTAFGRLLVERGLGLLADVGAIERELKLLDDADIGTLAIGAGAYPAQISVGESAARLIAQHPTVELRVAVADWPELIRRVVANELDLAVCEFETAEADERLVTEALPVHRGRLFCRAGHPLAGRAAVDLEAARRFPLALTSLSPRVAELARSGRREAGKFPPEIHVDTFHLAREIVLGSDAIGAATPAQIADDVKAGRLVSLPIERPWLATRYAFIYRRARTLSPIAQAFMALVREVEAERRDIEPAGAKTRRRAAVRPRSAGRRG